MILISLLNNVSKTLPRNIPHNYNYFSLSHSLIEIRVQTCARTRRVKCLDIGQLGEFLL